MLAGFKLGAASSFVAAFVDGAVFINFRKMWFEQMIHGKADDADQECEAKCREKVDRCQCPGQRNWADQCDEQHEQAESNCILD